MQPDSEVEVPQEVEDEFNQALDAYEADLREQIEAQLQSTAGPSTSPSSRGSYRR